MSDCAGLVVPTAWLPKVRMLVDKVALVPEVSPTPLRETECGLPKVLSTILIDALRLPIWFGLKVTISPQFAPAARLEPQLLVWPKSAALIPVSPALLMATAKVPLLLTVSA